MHHKLIGYLLYIVIASLIIVSLLVLSNNFLARGDLETTRLAHQVTSGNFDMGVTQAIRDIEDNAPSLTMSAEQLDPITRRLHGTLTLSEPPGVMPVMIDKNTKDHLFVCPPTGHDYDCRVKPQYASREIIVQVIAATSAHGQEAEFVKRVPFSQAFDYDASALGLTQIPFDIPVAGSPDLYPVDRYTVDVVLAFFFNPNTTKRTTSSGPYYNRYAFDSGTLGKTEVVNASPLCSKDICTGDYHLSIHRETRQQLYVFGVALIPLIFAVIFFHLLFLSNDLENRRFEHFTEAMIAAILAVLPLRDVLVPHEVEGLTRVDLVLGLGLVMLVSVAVGKYAREITQSRREASELEGPITAVTEPVSSPTVASAPSPASE